MTVRLDTGRSLAGWLFDVYVTDVTRQDRPSAKVASGVTSDASNCLLFPSSSQETDGDETHHTEQRASRTGWAPVLDPCACLPWVSRPEDLAQ